VKQSYAYRNLEKDEKIVQGMNTGINLKDEAEDYRGELARQHPKN